jgi:hypothetical protein
MRRALFGWITLLISVVSPFMYGCAGYHLMGSGDYQALANKGIRRVYIAPVENQTYKPGVDIVVYNEMLRSLASFGQIKVVQDSSTADARLETSVTVADYSASAQSVAASLFPRDSGSDNITVATEYSARLVCTFKLTQLPGMAVGPKKEILLHERGVWGSSFSRTKPFPANNQLGPFGTTSALINESEFDRILKDMAESMMADLHESMVALF